MATSFSGGRSRSTRREPVPVLVVEEAGVPGENHLMATSFSGGRNRSTRREPQTIGKQLVNFITCGCESSALFIVIYITWKRRDKIQSLILHLYGLEVFSFYYRKNMS